MHLSELTHPNQLHGLSTTELEGIARQIRERHLEVVSTSGGHLGPGLGVVELTLALYQTLDLDHDRVVWDVGHQAYPHKLITGRYNEFHTLRQKDGVAGYLKRCESPFDHFGAGHASTSISAALGMALARDQRGESFKCVAVIGDGSLTAQMTTVFTSLFLHAGWLHLIGNLWYLWIFGDNVEDRLGHIAFLAFYLASGVIAAIMHAALVADSVVPTVGASGAIAGVLGAYAFAFPRAKVLTLVPLIVFFKVVSLPAMFVLGLWFVFQFISGALSTSSGGGVAWGAHIAGFMFGFAMMAILARRRADRPNDVTMLP